MKGCREKSPAIDSSQSSLLYFTSKISFIQKCVHDAVIIVSNAACGSVWLLQRDSAVDAACQIWEG